jgi:catechol 2,3-dioxygenase-like lactoylglutathione lyase family enzyme
MKLVLAIAVSVALSACAATESDSLGLDEQPDGAMQMELGNFSISLAVSDIEASRAFYETLGFTAAGGDITQNWLILRNGDATIGLFQGMFEGNIMTFNPGWARSGEHPETFTDIRELQERLEAAGVVLSTRADESTAGPASLTLADPDGNVILLDQHR